MPLSRLSSKARLRERENKAFMNSSAFLSFRHGIRRATVSAAASVGASASRRCPQDTRTPSEEGYGAEISLTAYPYSHIGGRLTVRASEMGCRLREVF